MKNVIIPVVIFIVFLVTIIYFITLVPITITFMPDATDEIFQSVIDDMGGQLIQKARSEDKEINWLVMYVPRWKRIFWKKNLENNSYIEKVYDKDFLTDKIY